VRVPVAVDAAVPKGDTRGEATSLYVRACVTRSRDCDVCRVARFVSSAFPRLMTDKVFLEVLLPSEYRYPA
jgi:hypothetical protein